MLSQKELSSYVKNETLEKEGGATQRVLDLSKKELRKVQEIDIQSLGIDRINLSYNFIKVLSAINIVRKPVAVQNKQQSSNSAFQWLDVSFNIIQSIDNSKQQISPVLKQISYLNCCTNKLQSVNLSDKSFPNLRQLHLKNNRIKYFIHCPVGLEVLTLDNNMMTEVAFTGGKNLQILSAANNKIEKLAVKTPQLVFLDMENNQILDIELFYEFLQQTKKLLSVNLLQNPINFNRDYKIIVLSTCPKIVQIDQVYINPHVREGFRILKEEEKLEEVLEKTTQDYKQRLQAQLQYKEQMLEKLRLQEKQIEEKFLDYCQVEKEQMHLLEQHAKNTLGQQKFKIADQKETFVSKIYQQKNGKTQNNKPGQTNEKRKLDLKIQQYNYRVEYENFQREQYAKYRRPIYVDNLKEINTPSQNEDLDSQLSQHYPPQVNNQNINRQNLNTQNLSKSPPQVKKNQRNTYRNSRESILKKGQLEDLQMQGKDILTRQNKQVITSYKNLTLSNRPTQRGNLELSDVIDLKCISYLQKYYSFYE